MALKNVSPLIRFLAYVVIIGSCHFWVFAVCYFFYRRSYYRAPTPVQLIYGAISRTLGYPLWLTKLVPFEPNKLLFVAASMLNSLGYAVILALFIRLFRRLARRRVRPPPQ